MMFEVNGKMVEFDYAPFGIIGLETAFALCYTELVKKGVISLPKLIEKLTVGPAEVMGIENFNLADPNAKPQIAEATYYMTDENGKKGVQVMHVERPFFGKWTQNFNVQQILERFLCLTFPGLYKRLRFIAVCRECSSIFELLTDIACELEREEDKKEFNQPFEDANRSEWGKQPHEKPYRIRHKKSDDTLFKEELI